MDIERNADNVTLNMPAVEAKLIAAVLMCDPVGREYGWKIWDFLKGKKDDGEQPRV